MIIEGKKNLELMKRALLSHMVICTQRSICADEKTSKEKWDPELAEVNSMLDAVYKNLKLVSDEPEPFKASTESPQ